MELHNCRCNGSRHFSNNKIAFQWFLSSPWTVPGGDWLLHLEGTTGVVELAVGVRREVLPPRQIREWKLSYPFLLTALFLQADREAVFSVVIRND